MVQMSIGHSHVDFGFRISDFGLKFPGRQSAIPGTLRVPQSAIGGRPPRFGHRRAQSSRGPTGFTLVEMLVAMAITLVMMGAVVTLFANVSNSVRNRRATMELSGQIRGVRNVLQQDLQGATCPGLTWQRPESNHGYIELIEGEFREGRASRLIDGVDQPDPNASNFNPEIDHALSILPSSNLQFTSIAGQSDWATDGGGLGDYDDILMLTVRNEHQPFVGRIPDGLDAPGGFGAWGSSTIESQLAEVVWFSIENPEPEPPTATPPHRFFGEPGMRTIYRRTLLIAPWLNPYLPYVQSDGLTHLQGGETVKPVPGLLRLLPTAQFPQNAVAEAIAALVAFQDRYDISCRVEWDYGIQHWKIVANTLGDLTKRENRFCHYGFLLGSSATNPSKRIFPYAMISIGSGYTGTSAPVELVSDPEIAAPGSPAKATAHLSNGPAVSYSIDAPMNYTDPQRRYKARPFAYVDKDTSEVPATAQAILNDDGSVVRVVHGPVPLWGERRGEDVMLTDVIAFDLRVFDPGAPIFATRKVPGNATSDIDVVLTPSDPGWRGLPPDGRGGAYFDKDNMKDDGSGSIGTGFANFPYISQGAYVDLGYGFDASFTKTGVGQLFPLPRYANSVGSAAAPWFFTPRALSDVYGNQLAPGYAVYDTWSFHYENNGVNEDADLIFDAASGQWLPSIDEGTNGFDDRIPNGGGDMLRCGDDPLDVAVLGIDDVSERETVPPYDKPLRGVQLIIRAYERDSRAIKQVRVNQHFMPE
jgi:prepilin-type N-terminal cleavage/methylation domain-containing protein